MQLRHRAISENHFTAETRRRGEKQDNRATSPRSLVIAVIGRAKQFTAEGAKDAEENRSSLLKQKTYRRFKWVIADQEKQNLTTDEHGFVGLWGWPELLNQFTTDLQ